MRLACGVVDALVRYQLVDPDLFARLAKLHPAWLGQIEGVCALWFNGSLELDFEETYRRCVGPVQERIVVAPPPELGGVRNEDLR